MPSKVEEVEALLTPGVGCCRQHGVATAGGPIGDGRRDIIITIWASDIQTLGGRPEEIKVRIG